mmetsp:Transcript_5275/g.17659  ORF Transcript_5275/g.17659 Transcript_5275/m.17659 type:complete len:258 (+) Transcript_5275:124-897(+)
MRRHSLASREQYRWSRACGGTRRETPRDARPRPGVQPISRWPASGLSARWRRRNLKVGQHGHAVLAVLVDFGDAHVDRVSPLEPHLVDALDVLLRQLRDVAKAVHPRPERHKDAKGDHVFDLARLVDVVDADGRRRRRRRGGPPPPPPPPLTSVEAWRSALPHSSPPWKASDPYGKARPRPRRRDRTAGEQTRVARASREGWTAVTTDTGAPSSSNEEVSVPFQRWSVWRGDRRSDGAIGGRRGSVRRRKRRSSERR